MGKLEDWKRVANAPRPSPAQLHHALRDAAARVEVLESGAAWRRIDGPGIDGQRVMLRELDPFDKYNRGDENRDAIASGYWSDEYRHFVWPYGCTDHPPTHWSPMPDRLPDQSGEGGSGG